MPNGIFRRVPKKGLYKEVGTLQQTAVVHARAWAAAGSHVERRYAIWLCDLVVGRASRHTEEGDDMARQYCALTPSSGFVEAYRSGELGALQKRMVNILEDLGAPPGLLQEKAFTVVSAPSLNCTPELVGYHPDLQEPRVPEELIVSCEYDDPALFWHFREVVAGNLRKPGRDGDAFIWIGADPGGGFGRSLVPGLWQPRSVRASCGCEARVEHRRVGYRAAAQRSRPRP